MVFGRALVERIDVGELPMSVVQSVRVRQGLMGRCVLGCPMEGSAE
jgi:hypothetical protein